MDKHYQTLAETLKAFYPISDEVAGSFAEKFSYTEFKKKEIIVRPGEISDKLYFIIKGVQRSYALTDKEYTIAFSYPSPVPFFCTVPDSFLLNRPSKHYLESVTASKMLSISRVEFYQLLSNNLDLERMMYKLQELMIVGLHDRQTELMSLNMEERFLAFGKRSFHLFAKVPHKYIASYLNIDPTNLSKLLRKKLV